MVADTDNTSKESAGFNELRKSPLQTIKELYIGLAVYGVLFMILGMIFMRPIIVYALALLVGLIGSAGLVYNMYVNLDKALDMDSEKARSHTTVHAFLRLLVSAGLMVIGIMIHWSAFVGVTVGLLGLKGAAFMNPMIRKLLEKRENR
jgi:small-conductance mechanosensitive channel